MVGGTLQERLYIRPNDNIWCKIINDSCLLLACTVVIRSLLKHKYRMFTCISIWWDLPSRLGAHAEIKGPMLKIEFLHLRFSTLTTDCVHFWCAHPAESYYYIVQNNTSIIQQNSIIYSNSSTTCCSTEIQQNSSVNSLLCREAEKMNHFSFMNKSLNTQCNLTKFGTLIVNEYYHRCYLFIFWNLH